MGEDSIKSFLHHNDKAYVHNFLVLNIYKKWTDFLLPTLIWRVVSTKLKVLQRCTWEFFCNSVLIHVYVTFADW